MSYSSPDRVETNAARRLANPCDSGRIQRLQLSDYTTSADCYIRAPGWFDAVTAPPPKNSKMSSSTPRKFSEKIAIMERKQNEDVNQFEDIMREVRGLRSPSSPFVRIHPPSPLETGLFHYSGNILFLP